MSTDSDTPSGDAGKPETASETLLRIIEERYTEWESEFGDDVHVRRTVSFDPKK